MEWWVVMLLPLPVVALLGLGTVIAIAFNVSGEEDRRRLRLQRLAPRPTDVEAARREGTPLRGSLEDHGAIAVAAIDRVSTLQ